MRRNCGLTLVEVLALIAVVFILAGLILPQWPHSLARARVAGCASNLKQLQVMSVELSVRNKGVFPTETGGDYWLKLSRTSPPLIDPSMMDVYACMVKGVPPPEGTTDYRGPASDASKLEPGDPIGADKLGNHGPGWGINIVQASGAVFEINEEDALYTRALETTCP